MRISLRELAKLMDGEVIGNGDVERCAVITGGYSFGRCCHSL